MNKKNRTGCRISALLMAVVLICGASMGALAAEGTKDLDLDQKGSIFTALVDDEGKAMMGGSLALYQVAEVELDNNWNMIYLYTEAFADCGVELSQEALDDPDVMLAVTLAEWAAEQNVAAFREASVQEGEVTFSDLPLGVYLVVQVKSTNGFYNIDPFLVTLPHMENGIWVYGVDASPKVEVYPEKTETESETDKKKKSGSGKETEIESEKETESEEESEKKTSTPTASTPGSTTTGGSSGSTTSEKLPQTGQLNWPIPFLAGGGLLLILVGGALILSDRRKKNNAA